MADSIPQQQSVAADNRFSNELMRWLGGRSKTSLAFSAAVCFAIFWFLGSVAGIPADGGFNSSLLKQYSPVVAVMLTIAGLAACTLLMSVVQAQGEMEDPLLAVSVGLVALSCQGGTMTSLLQVFSLDLFWWLIAELVLLYSLLAGCWMLLRAIRRRQSTIDSIPDPADWSERALTTFISALVMGLCMYLFAQTDEKKQVFAAVGISAFAGAAAAYSFFEVRTAACYAITPLVVGVFGYLVAYFIPGAWQTGRIGQPLAYPLPLDYAGLGVAGSLLGYWTAQQWKEESRR